jgi:2-polyprenyl-6-methoxyphenol hydroxylase-like FAD-dependent oxidoreductase
MGGVPEQSTDVLVVGSGPVGATFARLIMERHPTASVTMVEIGPTLSDPPGMNVANLPPRARTRAQALSGRPLRRLVACHATLVG